MKLYHATTQKKAKMYKETGAILKPVRGFTTEHAALAWADAYCNDGDVTEFKCVFSAENDA